MSPGPKHVSSLTSPWHTQSQHRVHKGENAARKWGFFSLRFLFCRHLGGKCAADEMVQSNALHQMCGFGPWGSPRSPQTLVPPHTKRHLTTSTSPWCPKLGRAGGKHQVHGLAGVSEAAVTLTLAHEELPLSGLTKHNCQSSGHSTDLSGV